MHDASGHPKILSVGTALPEHQVTQEALTATFSRLWQREQESAAKVERLHAATKVRGRRLSLPLDAYGDLGPFAASNEIWRRTAVALGQEALELALGRAGLEPSSIDHLFFISSTGIATPSLDAALCNRMGLSRHVRRTPIFGLGCAGGAAGIARAAEWLEGRERGIAAVVAVELCSLTFQREDRSVGNAIAAGLFGDGAAAVILGRGDGSGPGVLASSATFYQDTEHLMGWDVVETGLQIRLSPGIPKVADRHAGEDVGAFLHSQGLGLQDIDHWLFHPGGPKVLEAIERALQVEEGATDRSWRLLEEVGNLSSASVLFLLESLLEEDGGAAGERGLLFAMGPGFSSEMVLLGW